jgi:hypothetical protein
MYSCPSPFLPVALTMWPVEPKSLRNRKHHSQGQWRKQDLREHKCPGRAYRLGGRVNNEWGCACRGNLCMVTSEQLLFTRRDRTKLYGLCGVYYNALALAVMGGGGVVPSQFLLCMATVKILSPSFPRVYLLHPNVQRRNKRCNDPDKYISIHRDPVFWS